MLLGLSRAGKKQGAFPVTGFRIEGVWCEDRKRAPEVLQEIRVRKGIYRYQREKKEEGREKKAKVVIGLDGVFSLKRLSEKI